MGLDDATQLQLNAVCDAGFGCAGRYEKLGMPSVRWNEPSPDLIVVQPELIAAASFTPQLRQLIRCVRCKNLSTVVFPVRNAPFAILTGARRNLPLHYDWRRAYAATPEQVVEEYANARQSLNEPSGYEIALVKCRRALERIVNHFEPSAQSPLYQRIDDLGRNGVLGVGLRGLAHDIRRLSNPAAHAGRSTMPDQQLPAGFRPFETDWEVAANHLETLIFYLFILPTLRQEHGGEAGWRPVLETVQSLMR